MIVIGVTGGVGTGKSTVARMFAARGARVLDADRITHALMRRGTSVWRKIRARFGRAVLAPDGSIDRRALGRKAFASRRSLAALCRIIHPAVRREIAKRLRTIQKVHPKTVAVLDVPLLIESGGAYPLDYLVVVSAPLSVAARRLKARAGWSPAEVKRRQVFQMPLSQKAKQADFVVRNAGSEESTRRQVNRIFKKISKEKG